MGGEKRTGKHTRPLKLNFSRFLKYVCKRWRISRWNVGWLWIDGIVIFFLDKQYTRCNNSTIDTNSRTIQHARRSNRNCQASRASFPSPTLLTSPTQHFYSTLLVPKILLLVSNIIRTCFCFIVFFIKLRFFSTFPVILEFLRTFDNINTLLSFLAFFVYKKVISKLGK